MSTSETSHWRDIEVLGFWDEKRGSLTSDFIHFLRGLFFYFLGKIRIIALLPRFFVWSVQVILRLKSYVTRKLIFGRGRLGRPVSQLGVVGLVVVVFLVAGTGWAQSRELIAPFGQEEDVLVAGGVGGPVSYSNTTAGEPLKYSVRTGDTLSTIGEQFKVSIDSIKYANNLSDIDYLKPGQDLTIPPVSGVLHTIAKNDTVESIAKKYSVVPQTIVDFNYLFAPFTLTPGDTLVVPGGEIPSPKPEPRYLTQAQPALEEGPAVGTGEFSWPTNVRSISQYFNSWHPAIDISKFSPIYAIGDGVVSEVEYSGWNYGYGKLVRINHGGGYSSLYAHLSSINVRAGQEVSGGQVIGNMGATGRAFGTHLHLEIIRSGQHINPLSVL